jgi:lipopolysaccharide transport system ATP-binding protein
MDDVAHKEGRTVLFVSHSMAAVKALCNKGMLLKEGKLVSFNNVQKVIDEYIDDRVEIYNTRGYIAWKATNAPGGEEVKLNSIKLLNCKNKIASEFFTAEPIIIEINYSVYKEITGSRFFLQILDSKGVIAFASTNHNADDARKNKGLYTTTCLIPPDLFNGGVYSLFLRMGIPGIKILIEGDTYLSFSTILMENNGSTFIEKWPGVVAPKLEWNTFVNEVKPINNI